jgi:neural Wiskott-Aldrich syndrome protein
MSALPAKAIEQYGGPGSFFPAEQVPSPIDGPDINPSTNRIVSSSTLHENSRVLPASLRPSSSLAKLDLYVPPYEQNSYTRATPLERLVNDFGELGLSREQHSEHFSVSLVRFTVHRKSEA